MDSRRIYLDLAVVTGATTFVEIILTRIFSVVLWYHFAFVAISLAMLGMAAGTMYVYLNMETYRPESATLSMGRLTGYFAAGVLAAYMLSLGICFKMVPHAAAVMSLVLIVGLWVLPFFLSGAVVSIALTRSALPINRLYAADLIGAAAGCLLVQPALAYFGPPAALALAASVLLATASWVSRGAAGTRLQRRWTILGTWATLAFAALCIARPEMFSPKWLKGEWEGGTERVFWNSYSRVAVFPPSKRAPDVMGWGMGSRLPHGEWPSQVIRNENIDADAGTWITRLDGDLGNHGYLAYDVINAVYHLRADGAVAVVGVGGGRDVLSALALGDHSITGIELNPVFIELLRKDYAAFSGSLAYNPRVRLVNAEARNWLERTSKRFNVIQISLIDTWAATASGAYVLSENSLYTVEAWRTFLGRLDPGGILSVSRWYRPASPFEAYRLAALAEAALAASGRKNPEQCVAVLTNELPEGSDKPAIVTALVSAAPLSTESCARIEQIAALYGFTILYSPTLPNKPYADLLTPSRSNAWQDLFALDVSAPTDDRPFFFHMLRPGSLLQPRSWSAVLSLANESFNFNAVFILGMLGAVLVAAAVALTMAPLRMRGNSKALQPGDRLLIVYFTAIGLAFMLVEIAIIQRTGIILGHPIFGLLVCLAPLLFSSGAGSLMVSRLTRSGRITARALVAGTSAAAFVAVLSVDVLAGVLRAASQPVRIGSVALLVLVLGFFMGFPFPTGIDAARSNGREELLPWLWGVNGVCSVLGAFLATSSSIFFGIQSTGLAGAACYLVACTAISRYGKSKPPLRLIPGTRTLSEVSDFMRG